MAGPNITQGTCDTPVSLLDLSATITAHFDTSIEQDKQHGGIRGTDLRAIAAADYDNDRVIFSEYHAAGAVTGAFMIRRGPWKYNHYVGFEPELFDLANDPEELVNLAGNADMQSVLSALHEDLLAICDPVNTDTQAHADQAAMIQRFGGRESALKLGALAATPPPGVGN